MPQTTGGPHSNETRWPVLIVGGGGCGLAMSILLSNLGIRSLLVERNAETTDHPRAHILNQRTMEIFRQHGLAKAVYAEGTPALNMQRISFRTSLGGDGPLDRRLIANLDGYGGGALAEQYNRHSDCPASNLPLMQLEPLLLEQAQSRGEQVGSQVHFGHELTGFEQDGDGVHASIRSPSGDYRVRAQYLIAADGGKTIGRMLGIGMLGPRRVRSMVNTYFHADLSRYIDDDGVLITYFINPDGKGVWAGGGLVKTGPTQWDRHSESWVFMREVPPDDPGETDPIVVRDRLRELLRIPDLEPVIRKIGRWDVEGVVAAKYRSGRVFLAGDAAHRHPPVSALGLNTAFGDVHNLAWKLKLVLAGQAGDALLDSYEAERQPVGARVSEWALNGFRLRSLIDAAIGIVPGQTEANRAAFESLFADTPGGATRRAILDETMHIQRVGPQAHDMEIGYVYERGALIPDGSPAIARDPMASVYKPNTRPGSRMPHAWCAISSSTSRTAINGAAVDALATGAPNAGQCSTHALLPLDRFTLFCRDDPAAWQAALAANKDLSGQRIEVHRLDLAAIDEAGEAVSPTLTAVLVRPDGHVAWRTGSGVTEGVATLNHALSVLLSTGSAGT